MAQTRIRMWFVSGLKKLPRVILRKPARRDAADTGGTGDTLPKYQSPILTRPGAPDVPYVEASDMPVEHPAPAPSEAHLHHSDGHSYRCHRADARSHGRSHVTYMDGRTDGRSHHTSHSVALDHILMTPIRQPIPIMNRMTPRRATPHQDRTQCPFRNKVQNPSSSSLHPTTIRWGLRSDPRCP
jgi:hypothetical protein